MDAQLLRLPESIEIYEAALEGLSRVNEAIYKQQPSLPELFASGAVYRRETGEAWRHVADVIADGWGDCEDLAAARVGWLRAKRIDRKARVKVVRTGPKMTHAIVARGNGKIEDPSKVLGMNDPGIQIIEHPLDGRQGSKSGTMGYRGYDDNDDRAEIERGDGIRVSGDDDFEVIGADPSSSVELSWTAEQVDGGWRGTVRVPLDAGRALFVSRTEKGATKGKASKAVKNSAVAKATSAASKVLANPAVAALIPPQAKFALNIVQSKTARNIASKLLKLF